MKKIILMVVIALVMSGCTSYNYKDYQTSYFPADSAFFCFRINDNNECTSPIWNETIKSTIHKTTRDWQLVAYYDTWGGKTYVFYGKILTNQSNGAIAEVRNFIKWAELPNNERISKKEEFEKNIKLNVIGQEYVLVKGVPYVQFKYSETLGFGSGYYKITLPAAKLILANLLEWDATLK